MILNHFLLAALFTLGSVVANPVPSLENVELEARDLDMSHGAELFTRDEPEGALFAQVATATTATTDTTDTTDITDITDITDTITDTTITTMDTTVTIMDTTDTITDIVTGTMDTATATTKAMPPRARSAAASSRY
ncbi:hypothetical protein HRG_008827 [Hirsutella rhossiliensis]|uniref:Uncharacterized protein n=1 Tax=Hirsutella rhossiliensis TaxID=111463 RepID=A0A9P8N2D2_9HYPO|nr:uncharacterized protein HRG_08827 [Hirsutella rhossiliensis]XP_044722860.1 uncharacterized protein HRG_03363 [Hirsutella rhossiliensis]KAH0959806.1 hypothetical protein HRG_08827 [Hirsutella rhossiliensis]KAH0965347.1 hypothetical protein HRG_03363 [Hirsutella rhossiliensis]